METQKIKILDSEVKNYLKGNPSKYEKVFSDNSIVLSNDPSNVYTFLQNSKRDYRHPEQKLMLWVLKSGIEDYETFVSKKQDKKFFFKYLEIKDWFFKEDEGKKLHPFTFANICDNLNIDKYYLRKLILNKFGD